METGISSRLAAMVTEIAWRVAGISSRLLW